MTVENVSQSELTLQNEEVVVALPNQIPSLHALCAKRILRDQTQLAATPEQIPLRYHQNPNLPGQTKTELFCRKKTEIFLDTARTILEKSIRGIDCIVYTTGSDGRLEKMVGRQSPIELCVAALDPKELKKANEQLAKVISQNPQLFFSSIVDLKLIDKDCLYKSLEKYIPTRVIQSMHLFGRPELYQKFLSEFANQTMMDEFKRNYNKFVYEFVKCSTSLLRKCLNPNETIANASLDLLEGIITYQPKEKKFGLKFVAMRCVQYTISKIVCDHLIKLPTLQERIDFLNQMMQHRQTNDLIDFCHQEGLLSQLTDNEKSTLQHNYSRMLTYEIQLQLMFDDQTVRLRFSPAEKSELFDCLTQTLAIVQKLQATNAQ